MSIRILFAILCPVFAQVAAAATPREVPGGRDHPMVSRYAGSVLQSKSEERFASLRVPAGPGRFERNALAFDKSVSVEGKLSSYFYVQPAGTSALEVFRNYQSALQQAGFTTLYSCEMQACDKDLIREQYRNEVLDARKWSPAQPAPSGNFGRDVRFLSAKATRNGADVYVGLFVAEPNSVWNAPVAALLVAEPAAMESGKVVVNTDALQKGLASEGRIALYGIYFDTGKAELKPESRPQLAEMAKLLQADKALKVFIVGHTDNEGTVDGNLALSQRRAEAVVAALASEHKIDAARLRARGVANFSPVASNGAEAGRAKNRRVELVQQ
jgi:OOP family OmpA-OmpF porin